MLKKICCYLLSFAIFISIFITAIDICCFDKKFYANEYQKLNTCRDIGVSEQALNNMTDTLLDYLRDDRDDLICVEEVKSIEREIFNQREKDHMVDVRDLYLDAITVRNIAVITAAVCLFCILEYKMGDELVTSYRNSFIIIGCVLAALVAAAIMDFDTFWTNFHHVFFPGNDLWLLDPATDILIMMVPSQFFFDLIIRIVLSFTGGMIACTAAVYLLGRKFND